MNGALAIFVKTVGHSPVKSRLAVRYGTGFAEDFHALAAQAVASVALRAQAALGITACWAVAEPGALNRWTGLPVIAQAPGGLGERMARVHAQLVARHGFGMLVGADAPQLSVALLQSARDWLAASGPRMAIGPARDGGFWLFGANLAPPLACWTGVEYSSAATARDLRANMQHLGHWQTLATLTDADRPQDLPVVLRELQALPEPTDEQRALAAWLAEAVIAAQAGTQCLDPFEAQALDDPPDRLPKSASRLRGDDEHEKQFS